jgi:hypothetical protein
MNGDLAMTVKTGMSGNTQKVPQTTTRDVDEPNIQASDSSNFAGIQTSQNTEPPNREATASIRGYHLQFDATINAILSLKGNATLTVEDIEDFNILPAIYRNSFNVSITPPKKLTASTMRDAILPMLKGFLAIDMAQ